MNWFKAGHARATKANNADTVDDFHASQKAGAKNSCVVTDVNGYINANYINSNTPNDENPPISQFIVTNGNANNNDNYYRKASINHVKKALGLIGDQIMWCKVLEGYFGIAPHNNDVGYVRTPSEGILPYQSGDYQHSHCTLGRSSWWFKDAYIKKVYTTDIASPTTWLNMLGANGNGIEVNSNSTTGDKPNALIWTKDNLAYLGDSYFRWKQLYAVNSSISTSDRNEKKEISYIGQRSDYDTYMSDEQLIKLIMGLLPVIFKRVNGESGRPHHGIISQDFEELLKEIGLPDHAAFIKSPKVEKIEVEKEIEKEVTKEDGTVKIVKELIKDREYKEIPDEYIYGIRYEELISDVIRFSQILYNKIQKLEKIADKQQEEIEGLKSYTAELEKRIEALEAKNN